MGPGFLNQVPTLEEPYDPAAETLREARESTVTVLWART